MNLRLLFSLSIALFVFCPRGWGGNFYQQPQSSAPTSFQQGLAALQENRLRDALRSFTQAENENPNDALPHNFRGIVLARLNQNAEAAAEFLSAIQLNPRLADAYKNLGFLQWTEHQLDPAAESLQHAIALAPGDSFAHYYFGRVHLDAQRYQPALHEFEISRVVLPTDPGFSLQLAAAYLAVSRREDAIKALQQTNSANLTDAQSVRMAALFSSAGQNEQALAIIEKVGAHSPSDAVGWAGYDLALANLSAGNYEKAITGAEHLNESLVAQDPPAPESPAAWTIIGIASAHLKQIEPALSALQHATALGPANEEYALNLTRELMELNRYAEAVSATETALNANPQSYALHLRLGAAQLAAGRYSEAESVFRELVTAGDPLPTGYVGLAQVLLRTGRAAEAIAELTAAEKKLGPTFLISYFLGLAYERNNQQQQAATAFRQAIDRNPGNAEAYLSLGKTQLGLGQTNEAIAQLQESLRLDPANDQARRLLSKAYARAGDTKRAAEMAQPVAVSQPNQVSKPIVNQQQVQVQRQVEIQQQAVIAQPAAKPNPQSAAAPQSTNTPENMLGDFFIPAWQYPPETSSP